MATTEGRPTPRGARIVVALVVLLVFTVFLLALVVPAEEVRAPLSRDVILGAVSRDDNGPWKVIDILLRDGEGAPVTSGTVSILASDPEQHRTTTWTAELEGRDSISYRVAEHPASEFCLEVCDAVDRRGRRLAAVLAGPFSTTETAVTVTLRPGLSITGWLVDVRGRPVSGVRIHASPYSSVASFDDMLTHIAGRDHHATSLTARDGSFELQGLGAGMYLIRPARHGGVLPIPLARRGGASGVRLILRDRETAERAELEEFSGGDRASRNAPGPSEYLPPWTDSPKLTVRTKGHSPEDRGPARLLASRSFAGSLHLNFRLDFTAGEPMTFGPLPPGGTYDLWIGPTRHGLCCYLEGIPRDAGELVAHLRPALTIRGTAIRDGGAGARHVFALHRGFRIPGTIRHDGQFEIHGLPSLPIRVITEDWVAGRYYAGSAVTRPGCELVLSASFDPRHPHNLHLAPDAERDDVVAYLLDLLSSDDPRIGPRYLARRLVEIGPANRECLIDPAVVERTRSRGNLDLLFGAYLSLRAE